MKRPDHLKDEARDEAYKYFDKNIRSLPKTESGEIDIEAQGLQDNDVDAFRHAYVSGVFTQEYSETAADIFGRMNEYFTADLYSSSRDPRALNMDTMEQRRWPEVRQEDRKWKGTFEEDSPGIR